MRIYFLLWMSVFTIVTVNGQIINKAPLSIRQTYYNIDAELHADTKTINAKMNAYWVNKSNDTVPDIRLHLYMNAFRNNNSTLKRESLKIETKSEPGWINLKSMTDNKGTDLLSGMKFISPDDGNSSDQTVAKIVLPKVALPGDTVFINLEFETRLPELTMRTGYNRDYFFVAQWFPKFGVYEAAGTRYAEKGAWNCHQFHANSEFYSDHSLYIVKITLPIKYVVGTCGVLVDSTAGQSDKKLTFRAEDIVDFAWTAWPGYIKYTDKWKNVNLTLLIPGERYEQVKRQFSSVKYALEYLSQNVGPYPWPYLTIVDPPARGARSGGMEYTTLFTSLSVYMVPEFIHFPEMVTIHEFGHAYFMGILASNEFEEPWLDEGVNTFWEQRIVDHYYGKYSGLIDHPLFKISDESESRLSYVHSEGRQLVNNSKYSWNYPHGTYGMMSYFKTGTWLYTLMGILGEETTNEIFREYYREWAFRHPSGKDFVNTVNSVVKRKKGDKFGGDMNWFFDQTLYGTGLCDYKVTGILNNKVTDSTASNISEKKGDNLYKSVAELERAGDIILPEEVLIHFDNGEEVFELWDGKSKYKDYEYTGNRKIEWVKIDPDFKIKMDIDYNNNSMTLNPDRIQVRRITNKLISFMQFFISIFSL